MRIIFPLSTDWRFHREAIVGSDGEPDAGSADAPACSETSVTLPHAWNTSPDGVPARHDDRGVGVYRRRIVAPGARESRRVFVEFGAAGTVAEVTCNDVVVGHHRGGYSAFRCDVTDTLDDDGIGELVVRVDNSPTDDVYPLMGDHTIFGGLYRDARLIMVDPIHIDCTDHGGPGVRARQAHLDDESAEIEVTVRVTNATADAAEREVTVMIRDADDTLVTAEARAVTIPAHTTIETRLTLRITNPRRWDGPIDPHRYRVIVRAEGDEMTIPLGVRAIHVDPEQGFFLNGRSCPLRGVSRHHDICGTPAVSDAEIARDMDLITEMGVNAVRLAHYQHAEAELDEYDRRGIIVWAEIPFNSQASTTDPSTNAVAQLEELIAQQRHHPSIVCWGIQNESMIGEAAVDPRPLTAELTALAKRLDPDRFTAQAQLLLVKPDDPINRLCDLNAQNLYQGWYLGSADEVGGVLDRHRAANPDIPLGLSEYGADARPEYHSDTPTPGDYTEDYQAIFHETYLRQIDERPWLWATFVWNMFDFASVIRNEGGTRGFNMKGLVTRDRATRKDAFFWYKANWSDTPMLHICAKRFANRVGDTMTVKMYSNQASVRLSVNGDDLGEQAVDGHIATWEIPLTHGIATVVATAGELRDEATFTRVDEPDPSYVCPSPRRVAGGGQMDSWYEDAGIDVDTTGYGTFSLLGELLDNPATKAVLIDTFGEGMLEHPQLEMARGFSFDFVLSAVAADMTIEDRRSLHEALAAIPKPPTD